MSNCLRWSRADEIVEPRTTTRRQFGRTGQAGITDSSDGLFDVLLISPGRKKIPVIKVVRQATGMRLNGAKELVDMAPRAVKQSIDFDEAESLRAQLELAGASVEVRPSEDPATSVGNDPERLVAKYAPGIARSIKLYASGHIESASGSGSVIGASAHVDQSGSKRVFRDTRQTYLTIEGPNVSISQNLGSNGGPSVTKARQFAAKVNEVSQLIGSGPEAPAAVADAQPDAVEQSRRLSELCDQGVLTREEFEAKKAELLDRI
jgi:ribosomal protein L7/L12